MSTHHTIPRAASSRTLRGLVATALTGLLVATTATSGDAAPVEHFQYQDSGTEVVEGFCGDVDVRISFTDRGVIQVSRTGRDRLPRFTVTHRGGSTFTNLATDKSFTIEWHYAEANPKVVNNGDGTVTAWYQVPGPEVIYGPDGQRLYVSGGMFRLELLVDTGGTLSDPSDDEVISEELIFDNGGQPQEPFDFCDSFRTLTG